MNLLKQLLGVVSRMAGLNKEEKSFSGSPRHRPGRVSVRSLLDTGKPTAQKEKAIKRRRRRTKLAKISRRRNRA